MIRRHVPIRVTVARSIAATALLSASAAALPALAQTNMAPSQSPAPSTSAPSGNSAMPGTTTAPGGSSIFQNISAQTYWRASDLEGADVYNNQNEKVGDVQDVVVGQDGKVVAIVVGVGGFLGMGEKDVAISFPAFRMTTENNGDRRLVADLPKATLQSAPAYVYEDPNNRAATPTPTNTRAPGATGTQPASPAAPARP